MTYAEANVITKAEIGKIMEAERQAMMRENPDLFAEMEFDEFLRVMQRHADKYIALLGLLTAAAQASYRDSLTKAAVEHLKVRINYERLDGVVKDYVIDPYDYRTRGSKGDLIFAYSEFGEGTRSFLVPSIMSLEFTGDEFTPEWDIPPRMQSWYDTHNLADIVIVIEPDIVTEDAVMVFPLAFEFQGVSYSFPDVGALFVHLLYLRLDVIREITAFSRIDGLTLSALDEYFDPIIAVCNVWLHLSSFLPPLYRYVFPQGQELWDTLLSNHSSMIAAIPDLADLPWACSVLLNEWWKETFGYAAPDEEILPFWNGVTLVQTGLETGRRTIIVVSANDRRSEFASWPTARIDNIRILLKHKGILGL